MWRHGPGPLGWGDLHLSTASFLVCLFNVCFWIHAVTHLVAPGFSCDSRDPPSSPCHTRSLLFCATLWTIAHQAPLSMGFSGQEYWSGLPFPPPGDLPDPRLKPASPASPVLTGGIFTSVPPRKPWLQHRGIFTHDIQTLRCSMWDQVP